MNNTHYIAGINKPIPKHSSRKCLRTSIIDTTENSDSIYKKSSIIDLDYYEDLFLIEEEEDELTEMEEEGTLNNSEICGQEQPTEPHRSQDSFIKLQQKKRKRELWGHLDIYVPMAIAMPTFIASLSLLLQAGSYLRPMFRMWVVICIFIGEGSGVMFEMLRFCMKKRWSPNTKFRWDRCVNYLFTALAALIYGVILRKESVYWIRIWIVTLLPMVGGVFKFSLHAEAPDSITNVLGTAMVAIEVYRITLIGAVLESSKYNIGLAALMMPLLYVEMLWMTALCTYFKEFSNRIANAMDYWMQTLSSLIM